MFGYISANKEKLTEEQSIHYKSCYCGLCKSLSENYGPMARITLNYDITFLVLVLSAIYELQIDKGKERCIAHPVKIHDYWRNQITQYGADMNIVLAYFNFLDDWKDEKKITSLAEAKFFESKYKIIQKKYPQKTLIIKDKLDELSLIEKKGVMNPDIPGNKFGEILGEIFVYKKDDYEKDLRNFGKSLGKFIYIMDAVIDFKEDLKKENYNPMVGTPSSSFEDILNILMGETIEKYKKLPVKKDKELIENILYSGVWMKYKIKMMKEKSDEGSL